MQQIDRQEFGCFLAKARKEKGLTQKQLAQRLFVSDKAVSKMCIRDSSRALRPFP